MFPSNSVWLAGLLHEKLPHIIVIPCVRFAMLFGPYLEHEVSNRVRRAFFLTNTFRVGFRGLQVKSFRHIVCPCTTARDNIYQRR